MTVFSYDTFSPRAGATLAYRCFSGSSDLPGVIFLGGFRSDMQGTKAMFLEEACMSRGQSFVRFDYTGHGLSSGVFEEGTIGGWLQDATDVFDAFTRDKQIVVGSSMGGWLALLLARHRKERVAGLVGIASAPDFSKDIYFNELTDVQRQELTDKGFTHLGNDYGDPYIITLNLYEEAKNHLLLEGSIDVSCPVRLIHGKQDKSVPWQKSEKIKECLLSCDVSVFLIDDASHSLSREQDLIIIDNAVKELSCLI